MFETLIWNKSHIPHQNNVFDRSTGPILKVYFEFIQVIYNDTVSLWQCFTIQRATGVIQIRD